MTEKNLDIPSQKDLIEIPKDETSDATIVDLTLKTWAEITKDEEKKKKLQDPNGKVLEIKYDAKGFIRQDVFPIPEKVTTASKYGRFLIKYNTANEPDFKPTIGMQIKVLFDGEGKTNIIIAK